MLMSRGTVAPTQKKTEKKKRSSDRYSIFTINVFVYQFHNLVYNYVKSNCSVLLCHNVIIGIYGLGQLYWPTRIACSQVQLVRTLILSLNEN